MSDTWRVQVTVVALFVFACGALVAAWLRGRLAVAAGLLFAGAGILWALDIAAIASGFHDADGFVDCRDACTRVHDATAIGFLAPPLLISLSAFAALIVLVRRVRRRLRG